MIAMPSLILEKLTQILVEGRKEDALRRVVKGIDDPGVISHVQDVFKGDILAQDPSGKQKYAMWAAGMINKRVLRLIKNYDTGIENDAQRMPPEAKYEATRRAGQIRNILRTYHKLVQKNLIEKDINKFKDLGDFEQKIYVANKELEEREAHSRREQKAKERSDIIDDADNWMMVRPNDEDGACYYGRGTEWCISATDSQNYFDEYTNVHGKIFYFVLMKHLHNHDPNKRMALVYGSKGDGTADEYEPEEVFDQPDDAVGTGGLRDAVYANLVMKGYLLGQENQKEFLKIFRSASGRRDDSDKIFSGLEGAQVGPVEFTQDIIDLWTTWMNGYRDNDGPEGIFASGGIPDYIMQIIRGLGLGDPSENDIEEAFDELVAEDYWSMMSQSADHAWNNPGGPTEEQFQEYLDEAGLANISVYFEQIDDQIYFSASAYINLKDEDFSEPSSNEFEDLVLSAAQDEGVYPDHINADGLEANIEFRSDYDEAGFDGFKAFVDRMERYDSLFNSVIRNNLEARMLEAGYKVSDQTYERLADFEDMDLKHFEADIEDGKVTITTFLPIRLYLPPELLARTKTAGHGDEEISRREHRYLLDMNQAILRGLRQNIHKLKDKIIARLRDQTDRALDLIASQQKLNLAEGRTGHPIPDYNINVGFKTIRTAGTELGGGSREYRISDRVDVWLDVQLEGNEEPEALKIIEKFVKMMDDDTIHERLRRVAEAIVTNMIVKEILPSFKKDHAYNEMRRQQQVAESSFSSFDDWKEILNEWRKYKK